MQEIPLTRGFVAIVDDEDAHLVAQYKWQAQISRNTVYAVRSERVDGKRRLVRMHRFILGVANGAVVVDHIDCNGLNNTRGNLRECSVNSNLYNRVSQANNTSGVIGVYWCNKKKKWAAYVNHAPNKSKFLGYFAALDDARNARREGELRYYGEFAKKVT